MDTVAKIKEWINENAPILTNVYQNKYVGMAYDRFASLPPTQQRQVVTGFFIGIIALIMLVLGSSYFSLWASSRKAKKSYVMVDQLLQYQKNRRGQSPQIQHLERNNQLAPMGAFKQYLSDQGRNANISPRVLQIEEKEAPAEREEDAKGAQEVRVKQAMVKIQRINLNQLKAFLQNIEFGQYNLGVSSLKITNDDKVRGYMNVEVAIVAYLFQTDENG